MGFGKLENVKKTTITSKSFPRSEGSINNLGVKIPNKDWQKNKDGFWKHLALICVS